MTHVIQIDQSGRTDETNKDTIFAFANGIKYSILIKASIKRDALAALKRHYREIRNPKLKLFCSGLWLLIQKHIRNIDTIIIDREYHRGHEANIRIFLLNHIRKTIPDFSKEAIIFREIKHSAAHWKAYDTYKGKFKPDYKVTYEELMKVLLH